MRNGLGAGADHPLTDGLDALEGGTLTPDGLGDFEFRIADGARVLFSLLFGLFVVDGHDLHLIDEPRADGAVLRT